MVFNTRMLGELFFKKQLATGAQQKVDMQRTAFVSHRKFNFNNENVYSSSINAVFMKHFTGKKDRKTTVKLCCA